MKPTTVSRLVGSLVGRELVRQNSERGKYQLGFGVLRLASSGPGRLSVVRKAKEVLECLAAAYKETVNLAVLRSILPSTWTRSWDLRRWPPTTGWGA